MVIAAEKEEACSINLEEAANALKHVDTHLLFKFQNNYNVILCLNSVSFWN